MFAEGPATHRGAGLAWPGREGWLRNVDRATPRPHPARARGSSPANPHPMARDSGNRKATTSLRCGVKAVTSARSKPRPWSEHRSDRRAMDLPPSRKRMPVQAGPGGRPMRRDEPDDAMPVRALEPRAWRGPSKALASRSSRSPHAAEEAGTSTGRWRIARRADKTSRARFTALAQPPVRYLKVAVSGAGAGRDRHAPRARRRRRRAG